jgi:hypothetical protein
VDLERQLRAVYISIENIVVKQKEKIPLFHISSRNITKINQIFGFSISLKIQSQIQGQRFAGLARRRTAEERDRPRDPGYPAEAEAQ